MASLIAYRGRVCSLRGLKPLLKYDKSLYATVLKNIPIYVPIYDWDGVGLTYTLCCFKQKTLSGK